MKRALVNAILRLRVRDKRGRGKSKFMWDQVARTDTTVRGTDVNLMGDKKAFEGVQFIVVIVFGVN